jgi:methylase of polypeptide subunit release factors
VKRPKLQEDEEVKEELDDSQVKEELDDSQQYLQDVKAVGLGICILDICCGAGAIGLCLMQRIRKAIQQGVHPKISFNCIGVELNEEAIKDARRNASENRFDKKRLL